MPRPCNLLSAMIAMVMVMTMILRDSEIDKVLVYHRIMNPVTLKEKYYSRVTKKVECQ